MSQHPSPISMHNGIFTINGQPKLLITSEYPYFRDHPSKWKDRLLKLKSIGINVITCYIPWRHHQPDAGSPPDFIGSTQSNRNILSFIDQCKELDLLLIVKPGPFIHAETNYGGLPDWVCPFQNPNIEPVLNNQMRPVLWWSGAQPNSPDSHEKWPLPAPFGTEYQNLTTNWLGEVSRDVISPNQYPYGPIVLVQLGNEGMYSDAQHALWDLGYSSSAQNQYRTFLQKKFNNLSEYNLHHSEQVDKWQNIMPPFSWKEPESENDLSVFHDWGEFQAAYLSDTLSLWAKALKLSVPTLVNVNPPVADDFGLDSWFSRVIPEKWNNIHYGFTNWIGDISADPSAFNRYILAAKRSPGPNLEENWGFSEIYDPSYMDASTSFYQTLVILNGGATGFNIYTGVGTSYEDKSLDSLSSAPYPDAAPITEKGEITYKGNFIGWLTEFFDYYGKEFLDSIPQQRVGWGYYLPDLQIDAWKSSSCDGLDASSSSKLLNHFQNHARQLNIDYGVLDLQLSTLGDLLKYQRLVLVESSLLDHPVKLKLTKYAQSGGQLALLRQSSELNKCYEEIDLEPNTENKIVQLDLEALPAWLMEVERPIILEGQADIWVRSHPVKDLHFITVLFPKGETNKVDFSISLNSRRHTIVVQAVPSGGTIFRIENGKLTDCIIKGINTYLDVAVSPFITFDNRKTGLEESGDFSLITGKVKRGNLHNHIE